MPIEHHENNRKRWNIMTDLHVNHPSYKTNQVIEGGSSLYHLEKEALGDVTGKKLLHLMCHFGLDTLSWAREGAIVTGADISDRAIEVANEVKARAGLKAEFIRSDLFDLPNVLSQKFDIVYQSYGTLGWLADVNKWAEIVSHFLQPDGILYFIDSHPVVYPAYDPAEDYFCDGPLVYPNEPDYCETDTIIEGDSIEYQYTVSQIFNALINAGLRIERLGEYPFSFNNYRDDWIQHDDGYWYPPDESKKFPLMLAVKARKV